ERSSAPRRRARRRNRARSACDASHEYAAATYRAPDRPASRASGGAAFFGVNLRPAATVHPARLPREHLHVGRGLREDAFDRRSALQSFEVRREVGPSLREWGDLIPVEQRRKRGAVGEREIVAHRPWPRAELIVRERV